MTDHENASSRIESTHQEPYTGSTEKAPEASGVRGSTDNHWATASELPIESSIHERRHYSQDDILRAREVLAFPEILRPIPVIERDGHFYAVDSTCVIKAAEAERPDFRFPVRHVTEQKAWAIRHNHFQTRFKKEPMALARRARLMSRTLNQEKVAKIIACNPSRVSQLCSAAACEEKHGKLKDVIIDPERISISFWQEVYATLRQLEAADEANPLESADTRLQDFQRRASELIENGEPINEDAVRKRLRFVSLRNASARRTRTIGKPVTIPGSGQKLFVDRERAGGTVLNLPQALDPNTVDKVIQTVLDMLARGEGGPEDTSDRT